MGVRAVSDEFDLIRSVNQRLLSDIARKRSEGLEQINALNSRLADIKKILEHLDFQRDQIEASQRIQAAFLQGLQLEQVHSLDLSHNISQSAAQTENTDLDESDRGKLKARIGDQRYLILSAVRSSGQHTIESAVAATGLPHKRVKDAFKADEELGVLAERSYAADGLSYIFYSLTDIGLDLLERFETYKRQKNQKLPNRADVLRDMGLEPPQSDAEVPPSNSIEEYGFNRTLEEGERPVYPHLIED